MSVRTVGLRLWRDGASRAIATHPLPRSAFMAKQILTFRRLALATGILAAVVAANASVAAEPDASASKSTPDVAAAIEARAYAYETMDFPGSSQTILWGMDDFGNLAGQYENA